MWVFLCRFMIEFCKYNNMNNINNCNDRYIKYNEVRERIKSSIIIM